MEAAARREESSGGAARKLTKRFFRPRSTPYDRPPREEKQSSRDGWLSKLVQPATRILPSLFFSSASSSSSSSSRDQDPPPLESIPETEQEDYEDSTLISEDELPDSEDVGASAGTGQPKVSSNADELIGDKNHNSSGLNEIEQRLNLKTFTRDETERLIELLRSRTADLPSDNGHAARSIAEIPEVTPFQKEPRSLAKQDSDDYQMILRTSEPLQLTARDVSSSPVDIAKAYMETRKSASGYSCQSGTPIDDKKATGYNSSMFLSSGVKSPVCWPGAVVHDLGYSTPQIQRGRIGFSSAPQTPRSGALFSKSTSKSQFHGISERSNPSFSSRSQRHTAVFGSNTAPRSSILNDGSASSDSTRQVRQKNMTTFATRGTGLSTMTSSSSMFLDSPDYSKGISSTLKGKLQQTSRGNYKDSSSNQEDESPRFSVGSSSVHPQSFKMAQKILDHLDRVVSPKEKSRELELAAASTNVPPKTATVSIDGKDKRPEASIFGRDAGAAERVHAQKVFPSSSTSESQDKYYLTSLPPKSGSQGQMKLSRSTADSHLFQIQKPLPDSSSKAASISDSATVPWEGVGYGFSFPVPPASSISYEPPPTPTMNSPHTVIRAPPTSEETVPSFNFGSSDNRPVFSFGSFASSTTAEGPAPKFKIGSDEHRNLSFKSVAKDAVCYS